MAGLSNEIERLIHELLKQTENGVLEIGRNDLAQQFGCAPSQINYVLTTRFTPYKGYTIESRRGGAGYIRIVKVSMESEETLSDIIQNTIGEQITKDKALHIIKKLVNEKIATKKEGMLMVQAMEDACLTRVKEDRNAVRADILRNMLMVYFRTEGSHEMRSL